ncbi:MAG: glycosyltransferase [Chitinophagaceae bacterium]|nr:glycosyltransferase [Anaerolineae bacterium]
MSNNITPPAPAYETRAREDKERLQQYVVNLAQSWDQWSGKNRYYHEVMDNLVAGMIPPGEQVLQLGAGMGDLLNRLQPKRGVGLNIVPEFTTLAQKNYPHLEWDTVDVDEVKLPTGFKPNYIVLVNMLDYVYDISRLMQNIRQISSHDTLVIMTTSNPLWSPVLQIASRLKLRLPESPRNFITNRDILSVLELEGFRLVEEGMALPVPRRIPIIGDFLNAVIPETPILAYTSSIQYIAARPHVERPPLSCSVVIPCHNEEGNIEECVSRVPNMGARTEIVVVDDGSKDTTRQCVQAVMKHDPRVRLIAFDKNQGKAGAVRAGFEAATGDVVMILDADMTVMPEDLPKFLQPIQEGHADFINGTRLIYPMQKEAMRIANFIGNKAFCFLISAIIRQRVSDTLCGTKALLRQDYLRMPLAMRDRWGDFDLLFGAARTKLRIRETPIRYQERRAGKSKMRVLKDGWYFLRACWDGWRMLRYPQLHAYQPHPYLTQAQEIRVEREQSISS